jgi:flagellar basal-body rod protein FlgB
MDYTNINLFRMMQDKMAYLSERQGYLSQNVANIDTPGFQPKDIKAPNFAKMAYAASQRLQMRVTDGEHMTPSAANGGRYRSDVMRHTYDITPVENTSSVEEQMMKVAENQLDYQTVSNLYGKMTKLFKIAIGKPN